MSEIYFSNYILHEETIYFLYIGELKNYGLNIFLKEALTKIHNRRIDFISIVPDIFEQYNYDNLIVINPNMGTYACRYGSNVSCRVSSSDFATAVSASHQVRSLIQTLLNRQDNLYLYMFESLAEMTLDEIPRVSILGPNKIIAKQLNNKSIQAVNLSEVVPYVDFRVCHGLDALLETTDSLWDQWTDGIFATLEYSAAGINSTIAHNRIDLESKFADKEKTYLITRFIPHEYDPTVLAVAINEEDVYIAGVADQRIENGNQFTGSTFPSVLSPEIIDKLKEHTRSVGRWLARQGYRGIFGCDFIVTQALDIYFLEINARKQGTTLEFCCTLEQLLPKGAPTLLELEYHAVVNGTLPDNSCELKATAKTAIHWGTYNYKLHAPVKTNNYIPQSNQEREAFSKIGNGFLKKDFLILEHAGSDFVVAEGSFLGRVVALGLEHHSVQQGLLQGKRTIDLTFENFHITTYNGRTELATLPDLNTIHRHP